MNLLLRRTLPVCLLSWLGSLSIAAGPTANEPAAPKPTGKMVDLGGHRLHVDCTGKGSPTVVVENGLGDFSFDWILVQQRVARFTRICTYDRAGYAWSDPGPLPRTFAQINMELRDALRRLGEHGPYVLVGHSYGGPAMRNFATVYASDVVGVVFVDAAFEGMRVGIGGGKTVRLGEGGNVREIPAPHERMMDADRPAAPPADQVPPPEPLDPMYKVLPPAEQKLQLWAQNLIAMQIAEQSQREWSEMYFGQWLAKPDAQPLGSIPTLVLTRAEGVYGNDQDVSAAQMEQERKDGQAKLKRLSSNSRQIILSCGHNMELEDPAGVADAIQKVEDAARHGGKL
jgi:pimeloyl-ACP methyl ester carboxylesterase